MGTMFGAMAIELKNRPGLHPSADDAFASFAKAGVVVREPKQSMGKTYKAAYCAHGVTDTKDLAVLLCEYADGAQAAAGLAESKTLFPGASSRKSYLHKTLLLVTTFQEGQPAPATAAAQAKVVAAFNAL